MLGHAVLSMTEAVCCGRRMKVSLELGRFTEMLCERCGDVIYVKKLSSAKPVMIDD